jgi:signal transduction histidine kinase
MRPEVTQALQGEPSLQRKIADRAGALFREHLLAVYRRTDRLFVVVVLLQWFGGILTAIWISPRTWAGTSSQTHLHVWAAVFLGGAISSLPIYLALAHSGSALTRQVIAVGQILMSALLIHLSGGRIETHFHVFASLALLACYRDWRVLATATLVTAIDHYLRGMYWPQSVYGVLAASPLRTLEHTAWVLVEDVFLAVAIHQSLREMREIADQRAQLEAHNEVTEALVCERTEEIRKHSCDLEAAQRTLEEQAHELELQTEQLQEARAKAEHANEAKSAFLANMSHEIRTPMTAIMGFADLLAEQVSTHGSQEQVAIIRRNGEHLLEIINDVLDISKIEACQLQIEEIICSPRQIVDEVATLSQVRAAAKGLKLSAQFEGSIPETIHTDPTRLRQILFNLVGNAVKFTEIGAVHLVARCLVDDELDARLQVDVVDTGIGMTADQVARLFHPFVQADCSTTRRFGGTGLGLSISKRLAEMLGGDIEVFTVPDEGSTFRVTVRAGSLAGVPMTAASAGPGSRLSAAAALHGSESGIPCRILLAEDGPDNQRLISFVLGRAGAEVAVVNNGQLAVERALQEERKGRPFDVILMDMQMPVLDGYGATARLRKEGYRGPIIALTAHAMSGEREKTLAAGCDEFATKPIDLPHLLSLIRRFTSTPAVS